jgi:hypothetical protein
MQQFPLHVRSNRPAIGFRLELYADHGPLYPAGQGLRCGFGFALATMK